MEIPKGRPISKSGVSVFDKCPMHYFGNYNLDMRDPSGPAADNGKMVHSWRERVRTGQCTLDDALGSAENDTVRWMTELALADDPYADARERLFEQEIRINESGELVDDLESAVVRGFLDEISVYDSLIVVEDLKTGKYKSFPPFERDLYAGVLAKSLYPDCNEIHFVHHWIQHNERPKWIYRWQKRLGLTICTVEEPDGKKCAISSKNPNPILDKINVVVDKIRNSDPIPNPGKHCSNWYGMPCQFKDTICPAYHADVDVMALLGPTTKVESDAVKALRCVLAVEDEKSLLGLEADTLSVAYQAVLNFSSGLKQIEKKIKAWADANGPITVGDSRYGWHDDSGKELSPEFALNKILQSGMEVSDIIKCVNISKSSIEKISKRKWGEVRESILTNGLVDRKPRKVFGILED